MQIVGLCPNNNIFSGPEQCRPTNKKNWKHTLKKKKKKCVKPSQSTQSAAINKNEENCPFLCYLTCWGGGGRIDTLSCFCGTQDVA